LEKLRLKRVFKKILPFKRYGLSPNVFVGGIREEKAKRIDWDKSRVIASGQGPLYLIGSKGGSDYEDLRNEVIASLRGLKDPETGKHIAEKIYRKEEVYPVVLTDNAPDIVFESETSYRINGELGDTPVFVNCWRWAAENDPPGIFIAYGKDIKALNKLPNINITDLAPTILHWMDIPVPEDMDGRIMKEIFRKDSNPDRREIKRCKSDDLSESDRGGYNQEEEKMVRESLKELGYLDG
jgi:predicted AlkP superfamily phosphohydrolase/phosphomutase